MKDFFDDAMAGGIESLSSEQLDEMLIRLQARRDDLNRKAIRPICCPECGSISIKSHGSTKAGTPRMICKDCGKSWSYGNEFKGARLNKNRAAALIIGLVDNQPIRVLAERMGVSESTAHRYKIQMCDILAQRLAEQLTDKDANGNYINQFSGDTQIDEWFSSVSFKGKHNPDFFIFDLRRFPRHHMSEAEQLAYLEKHGLLNKVNSAYLEELRENTSKRKRGTSNDQACIVVAVDEHGKLLAKNVSVGRLEIEDAKELFNDRLADSCILITDCHNAYPAVAEMEHVRHIQIQSDRHIKDGYSLGTINSVHSEMEKFFSQSEEREVATKYLPQYLALFIWRWQHKTVPYNERIMLLKQELIEEWERYNESYDVIKSRPFDMNTKGMFKNTDV